MLLDADLVRGGQVEAGDAGVAAVVSPTGQEAAGVHQVRGDRVTGRVLGDG